MVEPLSQAVGVLPPAVCVPFLNKYCCRAQIKDYFYNKISFSPILLWFFFPDRTQNFSWMGKRKHPNTQKLKEKPDKKDGKIIICVFFLGFCLISIDPIAAVAWSCALSLVSALFCHPVMDTRLHPKCADFRLHWLLIPHPTWRSQLGMGIFLPSDGEKETCNAQTSSLDMGEDRT